MARSVFGGGVADYTFILGDWVTVGDVSGQAVVMVPGADITVWSAETDGVQYTDLTDLAGTPITSLTSSTGSDGRAPGHIPPFMGPDGVNVDLWASANAGPRVRLYPRPPGNHFDGTVTMSGALQVAGDLAVNGQHATALGWLSVADEAAVGDGVTDDQAAIQATINACPPGGTVYLPPGRWAVGSPVEVPPMVRLLGGHGNRTDNIQTGNVLMPLPTFSGDAVIRLLDQEEGDYATENEGVRLENLTVDGTGSPAGVHAIHASGRVHGVVFDRVSAQNITGDALLMTSYTRTGDGKTYHPYSWNLWHCIANTCGGNGWALKSSTDSTLINCEAIGCAGAGILLDSCPNTQLVAPRAEWCGTGIKITGNWLSGQGAGGLTITSAMTDRNSADGIYIDATGTGPISITGPSLRRDGRNGYPGDGGGGYAGLRVNGATMPVEVSGIVTFPGVGDDNAGVNSPQYGVSVTGSTQVVVTSGSLHAAAAGWHDGGGNGFVYRGLGVVTATGPTNSPIRQTRTSLAVSGRALGVPQPRDHGKVLAWTYDPAGISAGKAGVAGTLYMSRLPVPEPASVVAIRWGIAAGGAAVSPVAGQNFVGLINSAGVTVAVVDVTADITSVGVKNTVIAVDVDDDDYSVGWLINASTMPQILRLGDQNATLLNVSIPAAAQYRFCTNGTGRTTFPASITPSANVAAQFSYFAALVRA